METPYFTMTTQDYVNLLSYKLAFLRQNKERIIRKKRLFIRINNNIEYLNKQIVDLEGSIKNIQEYIDAYSK